MLVVLLVVGVKYMCCPARPDLKKKYVDEQISLFLS